MTDAPWPVKTLSEVLTLAYGKPLEARDRDENGPIPVYGANGVKAKSRRSLVAGPGIIVGRKGSAGELNVCKGPFWPLDVTYYVEHDSKETDLLFLYYLLSLMDLPRLAKGVKPGINRNEVYALTALVPPLEEQKRIAALLDDATARINELTVCYEQARTHANNLFTSALRAELEVNTDWPVKTLGEVCDLVSRGRPPSYCEAGGVLVLNQKCVRNGRIDFGPSRRTDNEAKAIPEWAYVCEGDTLINSTGTGTLGRAAYVSKLSEPTTFDTHLTVVRPRKSACLPAFIGLVLNGREEDIIALAGGTTGQTELPREAVRSFEIPVPSLEEQKRIVVRLDSMRAKTLEMVAAYDAKLQAAKNLRQSILESAFAGEL